jgi:rhodanese-related sulfurtransferase
VGGGYIGLECAEQFINRGIRATVVEAQDQIMGPLDPEVTRPIQVALEGASTTVILGDAVARIESAGYYPDAAALGIKLVFAPEDGRLLWAQAGRAGRRRGQAPRCAGHGDSARPHRRGPGASRSLLRPPFGAAKDIVIMAGFIAPNAQRGIRPSLSPMTLREELQSVSPPFVVDVCDEREYETEHLKAAVNIPLEGLRERLGKVPKDRPVVVHCSVGYRSYVAQQILREHGWTNVRNLYGGLPPPAGWRGSARSRPRTEPRAVWP